MGKSKELPYPVHSTRVLKACGDLVSVDGWGPLRKHPDWNGNTYYIVFIDHYSGNSFLYLYSSPSQVASIVVEFLTEVETFLGHPVKVLRSDGEGGYISKKVKNYCSEKGIRLERTLPDAHQQNGMSEGFNAHCLATIRTMLIQAQLGSDLWGEAALNYSYTKNKLPTSGHEECPDTLWYGKKPNISHMRSFGEKCFAHVMPKNQQSKIDPRAYAAIFLGYDLHTKAYRLMDPQTHSLFLSRSVQFLPKYEWPDPTTIGRFGNGIDDFSSVIDQFVSTKMVPVSKQVTQSKTISATSTHLSNRFEVLANDPLSDEDSDEEDYSFVHIDETLDDSISLADTDYLSGT
jgi:hypothetical protein